ncbi:MAG: isoaspartyl peptidase/L-asparaginase [Caldilineaceae bacterium]|nr:isoaspartyl peptidase/L-asparaginase [Caldilineaceae bacterium]
MSRVPVIVASENGRCGAIAAMNLLRNGGAALDAVELASRIVEDDPEEHSVGYSGLPNVLGEVELDASIMDGRTLQVGAVAAVRGYGNPITLARHVMTETPHVLIVAGGRNGWPPELNIHPSNQLSEEALRRWRARYDEYGIDPHTADDLRTVATRLTRPVNLRDMVAHAAGESRHAGHGQLHRRRHLRQHGLGRHHQRAGVEISQRVGDSPIIGAGNYCDNRYGGAACTGMGELAIRVSTARSLVLYMKMGMSLRKPAWRPYASWPSSTRPKAST